MLYERHSSPKYIYRIIEGRVRFFFLTEGGREMLLKIFAPPETLGDIAGVDGQPYPAFAETDTDCEFQLLTIEKFRALRNRYPAIDAALLDIMTAGTRILLRMIEEATVFSLQARIAARLCRLVASAEARGESISELKIPQKEIGLMVGASRQAVNKVLADLQKSDVVKTQYGAIEIIKPVQLCEIGCQEMTGRQNADVIKPQPAA